MIIPLTVTFLALTTLQCNEAFHVGPLKSTEARNFARINGLTRLQLSQEQGQPQQPNQSQKLARLNAMAAKLRAEASLLEVLILICFHFPSIPFTYKVFGPYWLHNFSYLLYE